MTVSLSGVHVLVDDPDAALGFYRDTLGLTVVSEVANDGFRWIMALCAALALMSAISAGLMIDGKPGSLAPGRGRLRS